MRRAYGSAASQFEAIVGNHIPWKSFLFRRITMTRVRIHTVLYVLLEKTVFARLRTTVSKNIIRWRELS